MPPPRRASSDSFTLKAKPCPDERESSGLTFEMAFSHSPRFFRIRPRWGSFATHSQRETAAHQKGAERVSTPHEAKAPALQPIHSHVIECHPHHGDRD